MKKINDLQRLRFLTTRKDKVQLLILIIMTFILSVIETIGVGIIMPFITFASNPSLLLDNKYGSPIYHFFNFSSTKEFMFAFSGALIAFYIFRSTYNIFYNYKINLFAFEKYHNLAYRVFQKLLRLNYAEFVNKNSDLLRRNILNDTLNSSNYVRSFLLLCSETISIVFLYSILLLISWKMTLVLTAILSAKVLLITKTISKTLGKKGEERMRIEGGFLGLLSNTFGNFKIIKLKDSQNRLEEAFLSQGLNRAKVEITAQTLMTIPKNFLESIGFCILIASVAYILYKYDDASAVLPIISMYALALYKILPSVNKILEQFNAMKINQKSLEIVYDELKDIPYAEGDERIDFANTISLQNVSFGYYEDKTIITNCNLTIQKGDRVAFVGPSGAGKSTLVDIISGFYAPNVGEIYIDGRKLTLENIRSWRKKFGYIPQSIYLFDGSVGENIAFGSKYDSKRIAEVCKIAKIDTFLNEHQGIDTKVGDGGIKLSGGQKQRIGIARAIYDNPEILVLDEATSALDNEVEAQIMDEIYELSQDKTLLVIAHRLSTVERCDYRIQIQPHKPPKRLERW
ncbi:hypothetical protein BBW65_01165 [Helicobacter enhydrae]|uniref:Multidrug transporter n=1 Tax=Helicobacter enhydrae TaxID=222136 RepID=A0A1B1U482_9HELI|nr:ABC transporter ATP-binding protein [Helicobacter enhydrae]ANV97505.1 hypothetical protein BBW65_01165 [Helicobacter enhydrae]